MPKSSLFQRPDSLPIEIITKTNKLKFFQKLPSKTCPAQLLSSQ